MVSNCSLNGRVVTLALLQPLRLRVGLVCQIGVSVPFTNPIVAGNTLVRTAIQSENFAITDDGTITGWSIDRDGQATFTDVTIGGVDYNIDETGAATFRTVDVSEDITLGGTS